MPILWRYLLQKYFQVLTLCVFSFVAVLFVTRFQHIARFAATGASKLYVLKFILYQIPFVLPLTIPISCLISAFVLFHSLSHSKELTALRASGIGIGPILFPLLASSLMLGTLNFTIASEISPRCRALSKSLAYEMAAINPLCLLQKETLIKLKDIYVDMKVLKSGKYAEDVIFIMRNLSNQRLGLVVMKKLFLNANTLVGEDVTFISSIDTKNPSGYDHLVIENQTKMQTKASDLSLYLRGSDWKANTDYMNLRLLRAKHQLEKGFTSPFIIKASQEVARRFSLALAAFTFTFIGSASAVHISRKRKFQGILLASSLSLLYFIAFMAAKSMKHSQGPAVLCYLLPHPILCAVSFYFLRQKVRGAE